MTDDTDTDDSLEREQLNVRVRRDWKEAAAEKLPHGGLTDAVNQRLREIAEDAKPPAYQETREELQDLRDERRELKTERNYLDDQIDDLDVKIGRLERELEEILE